MALPRYDEIHLPLLKLFLNKCIYNMKDAVEMLAKEFKLSEEDLNERVPSGERKFYSQVSFSKMHLVRASEFSSKAQDYVKSLRNKEITLIDGCKLVELIFKYNLENEIISNNND